jgi:hypothetical protein
MFKLIQYKPHNLEGLCIKTLFILYNFNKNEYEFLYKITDVGFIKTLYKLSSKIS